MVHIERVGRGGFTLWLLLLVFAFWGGESKGSAGARGHQRAHAAAGSQAMSPALRAAYLTARQVQGGEAYAVRQDSGGLVADNPAQGFSIAFSEQGVALTGAGAPRARLMPMRFGCPEEMRELGRARPERREGRVAFPREGFVEWYVNGPLGLEQGFTVEEPPRCAGAKAETLEVELGLGDGLSASLEGSGEQIALRDGAGRRVLGLSELYAIDAKGNVLPARLGVTEGHGVSMRVEAAGAAYPLVIDPLVWKEEQQLLASDGAANGWFGYSVAISGDTAIIGAPGGGERDPVVGAAYVFVREGASWSQQAKLLPSDGAVGVGFGWSVAISGDTAIVGAEFASERGQSTGGAYVFVRQGSTWSQQAWLAASDGAAGDNFGNSVALSGDTALIGAFHNGEGAAGAAYVFLRQGTSWSQQAKLLPSDARKDLFFGNSVALSGDTALIGAPDWLSTEDGPGEAYVFLRQGASWSQQAKLRTSDGVHDGFGYSVALSGDTTIVGAPYEGAQDPTGTHGAAYIFLRQGASWSQQAKLLPSDEAGINIFGGSVALSGEIALIGSDISCGGSCPVYVFVRQGSSWSQQTKLLPSDGTQDHFFDAFALSGATAIVAWSEKNDPGGVAYAFGTTCSKDTDCSALPAGDCAVAVCNTATSTCGTRPNPDDTPCPSGTCSAGVCRTETAFGGCGCSTRGAHSPDALGYGAMLLLGLLPLARRSARRRA